MNYSIYAESTPNPEVMKFVSNRMLADKSIEILNAKEALKLTFEWHKIYNNRILRKKIVNFTKNQIINYKKKINYI